MLYEIDKSKFWLCESLMEGVQLEARAVVSGTAPGRIFVDDTTNPNIVIVWPGNNDGFFFVGDELLPHIDSRINEGIDKLISVETSKIELEYIEVLASHPRWNKVIKRIFSKRDLGNWIQYVYIRKENAFDNVPTPNENTNGKVSYVQLKDLLLQSSKTYDSMINVDQLKQSILQFWPTIEQYLNYGIGYGAIVDNKVISFCYSSFVLNNEHAVSIETHESYRRAGHALALAQLFAHECQRQGKLVYWDCMESNLGSIAIAERIGCQRVRSYSGYYFKL